jgi:hypothetical protein
MALPSHQMKIFRKYAEDLDTLLDEIQWGHRLVNREKEVNDSLNGQAAEVLRSLASSARIRRAGAFFTGPKLADLAINHMTQVRGVLKRPVYDPTCGAGDLLLRWADALPVSRNLQTTIENWERFISGRDLHPEFISAARRRLVLKAITRGARLQGGRPPKVDDLFRGLREGDARFQKLGQCEQTIVMNPPFTMVAAPDNCEWSSGKVCLAALLFHLCLKQAASKTRVVAILPDVLRSGSRYARWRELVAERFDIHRIQSYGRFDCHADVDVFIVEGIVGAHGGPPIAWWTPSMPTVRGTVSDYFDVSVGAVVPHRDPHLGPWAPFATSKSISPWTETKYVKSRRRFKGTKVVPPFIAIRRTSSPRDPERAIGSIVTDPGPVAVENHLLVLKPHDGTHASCISMLRNLKNPLTNIWLNQRIRCRHLTVGIIGELPVWEKAL